MRRPIVVYGLASTHAPRVIRYVGQTSLALNTRVRLHRWTKNARLAQWLRGIKAQGARVHVVQLGQFTSIPSATRAERSWWTLLSHYADLLNQLIPGTGHRVPISLTEDMQSVSLKEGVSETHDRASASAYKGRPAAFY